jgi:cell division protease FtsH
MLIDQLVELLLEIETLEGEQFRKLVAEHTPAAVKVS